MTSESTKSPSPTSTRAVLFDLGGTLYDYGTMGPGNNAAIVATARRAGIAHEPRELMRAYMESLRVVYREYLPRPFYLHRDMFGDALTGMATALGVQLSPEDLDFYHSYRDPDRAATFQFRPGVPETLQAIRDSGLHLGIVSNVDQEGLENMTDIAGLDRWFHSILSSEAAGSCKPHQGIFSIALERAGCEPHECLFIGDSLEADIAGSNMAGMRSVLLWHRTDREPPLRDHKPAHIVSSIPEILDLL